MARETALRALREIANILLFDFAPLTKSTSLSIVEEASQVLLLLENLLKNHPSMQFKLDPYYVSIYEDMCQVLLSQKQYKAAIKVLERGVARHYELRSFWFQFALVLVQDENYARAHKVLNECVSMSSAILEMSAVDDAKVSDIVEVANILLLKCKVCLKLDKIDEALNVCNLCKKLVPDNHILAAKLYEYMAICNFAMVPKIALLQEKQAYQKVLRNW